MTANVVMSETFSQQATKINELAVMTQDDGMNNFIKVLNATNSTSNTSGSIITVGGVGIGKSVVIGENINVHGTSSVLDTTQSTSNTTGSIITSGGVGIAKDVTIGGSVNVHGDIHANGSISADGSLTFGDADTDNIVFSADVNSHIIPNTDDTYDLGSTGQKWQDIYAVRIHLYNGFLLNDIAVTADATQLNSTIVSALGTSEASKVVTADASGNVTFQDGAVDVDIASHDGTNGLKLGGTLVTTSAADLNKSATTGKSIAMAIVFGG